MTAGNTPVEHFGTPMRSRELNENGHCGETFISRGVVQAKEENKLFPSFWFEKSEACPQLRLSGNDQDRQLRRVGSFCQLKGLKVVTNGFNAQRQRRKLWTAIN